jgi:excisionase family DNA binding protein
MDQNISYLNSEDAARILGVNVSSIKRWTDSGKLECIQTDGGHRKFQLSHLSKFLENHKKQSSKAHVFPIENDADLQISHHILKGNFNFLIDHVYLHALNGNRQDIQKVLNGLYLSQYPLHQIYDRLITPVLHHLGEMWENGTILVNEEHIASQCLRDCIIRLQGIIHLPKTGDQVAICINPYNELHDIALKMVENILESRGFRTYFSGQLTPVLKLDELSDRIKPQRLYLGSTVISDPDREQQEVDQIFDLCKSRNIDVYLGGQGWDNLKYDPAAVKGRLNTFEEVFKV